MGHFFFFLKCVIYTFIFVLLMQVKVGQFTMEERLMFWVHDSPVVQPLHEVAHGGVKMLRQGWKTLIGSFKGSVTDTFSSENLPGKRDIHLKFRRSQEYIQEKAHETAEGLKDEWQHESSEERRARR